MTAQDVVQGALRFDGATISPELDQERLETQLARVKALMKDGHWRTLREIQAVVGGSEAGVSARLRDFKKLKFGAHDLIKRRRGNPKAGLWEYQVSFRGQDAP